MDYQMHHRIQVWLEEAAVRLRQSFREGFQVEEKSSASDLVTEMDQATERFFVDKIRTYYPDHRVMGEEGYGDDIQDLSGYVWIIDPIDGTLNFVKQHNNFGMMIGIYKDGQPVAGYIYDVMQEELFAGIVGEGLYRNNLPYQVTEITDLANSLIIGNTGMFALNVNNSQRLQKRVLGVRATGSAALEILSVLKGEAALYLTARLNPWDVGAGLALCETVGFKVSQPDGSPVNLLERGPVLFSHPAVHQEAIDILQDEKEVGEINELT